ncbi:MAG: 4'-phosphopantetheinyl transferase superfamily protein [Thermodesulfobacteriota bacterium]
MPAHQDALAGRGGETPPPALLPVVLPVHLGEDLPRSQWLASQRAAARAALDRAAARFGISLPADLPRDERGAPLLLAGIGWSVSHKPSVCAAVVGWGAMGIDIEEIRPRQPDLVGRVGTAAEWAILGGRGPAELFRLWTAKEAVLKAAGIGIAGLDRCRITGRPGEGELALVLDGRAFLVALYGTAAWQAAVVKAPGQAVSWEKGEGQDGSGR